MRRNGSGHFRIKDIPQVAVAIDDPARLPERRLEDRVHAAVCADADSHAISIFAV